MSAKNSEHGNSQDDEPLDNSMLDSFNLFLSLMTPVEFAKLLRSRVNHLLQTWPSPSTSDNLQEPSDTSSYSNPPYMSMDSVLAFTSFFRTQDTPTMSESGVKLTPSSPNRIRQHLKALETLLSCLTPKELQELINSRLKEGDKERTNAIRGLMDVMRRAASVDETPENKTVEEKSSLHLNLGSNVDENETSFTKTYTVNLSPGTAPIPRVMSPGTRDQSVDDSKKTSSPTSRKYEPRTSCKPSVHLMSPTLPTSKVSTSSITSPTRGNRRNAKLESSSTKGRESVSKSPNSRPADSTLKPKSSASSPYSKVPQSTRRTRSSAALLPEPSTSRNQTKARVSEKPRRKSERLSKRNQPVTRSRGSKQNEPAMPPSPPSDTAKPFPPTSSAASSSRNELSPISASDQALSSFFPPSAEGRTSPPGPVLRAVDWSTPVRSTPVSSEEDREMEDEEEELDELADDTSEGRVSEIINGWNSHMEDAEPEVAPPPSSTDRTSPIPPTPVLKEELIPSEVVLTPPPKPGSPIPPLVSLRSSPSITEPIISPDKGCVIGESCNNTSVVIHEHSMEVDSTPQVPPEIPPPTPSTPPIPPPVYPSFYSNPHPPPSRNSYQQIDPPTLVASQHPTHSPQLVPAPSHHHSSPTPDVNVSTHPSYVPSSQLLHPHHHHVNPYPPPQPPNQSYTHDYRAPPPPPPPPHIPPYPTQHSPYTPSSWYGNPYYPPQPPPYHQYPQQPNMSMPPNRDQHHHAPHPQLYPPPHYSQQPPLVPPPQFPPIQTPQSRFPPLQDRNQSQFPPPPQPSVNHYHHPPPPPPPPSFPPSGPSTSYPHPSSSIQQQGLSHSHYPTSQSTSVHLPHHFPSPHSHLAQSPAHPLVDDFSSDTVGSRSGLYTMNINGPTTMSAPRPPSPIIPPPLGPRPSQLINPVPSPQRRSPSPPVKPPEGPKRFFQKRRTDEEGGDVNFPGAGAGAGDQDDPNVRYTSEVGIKETLSVRRRCHNCRTVEAPSWRKSKLSIGKILCNKCGIYESTHLMARPLKTRPRRLMLSGEQRDPYQFEVYNASPVTPFGSPTFGGMKRGRRSTSDNDDDLDFDFDE